MFDKRVFKFTVYHNDDRLGFFRTVVMDEGQKAKKPGRHWSRVSSFYGVTDLSREEMEKKGYIVLSKLT